VLVLAGLLGIVHESALQQQLAPLFFLQHECAFLPFLVFFLQQFISPGSQQPSLLQQAWVVLELLFWGVPKLIAAAEIAKLPPQTIAIMRAFIFLISVLLARTSRRVAPVLKCGQSIAITPVCRAKFSRPGYSRQA
jgi:hypothetical protein